jgi:hypothetical protein
LNNKNKTMTTRFAALLADLERYGAMVRLTRRADRALSELHRRAIHGRYADARGDIVCDVVEGLGNECELAQRARAGIYDHTLHDVVEHSRPAPPARPAHPARPVPQPDSPVVDAPMDMSVDAGADMSADAADLPGSADPSRKRARVAEPSPFPEDVVGNVKNVQRPAQCARVRLNVGGRVFETTAATLLAHPDTLLGRMFSGGTTVMAKRDATGAYFFDRDPTAFAAVLEYMRTGRMWVPRSIDAARLRFELVYWGLAPELADPLTSVAVMEDEAERLRLIATAALERRVERAVDVFRQTYRLDAIAGRVGAAAHSLMLPPPREPRRCCDDADCAAYHRRTSMHWNTIAMSPALRRTANAILTSTVPGAQFPTTLDERSQVGAKARDIVRALFHVDIPTTEATAELPYRGLPDPARLFAHEAARDAWTRAFVARGFTVEWEQVSGHDPWFTGGAGCYDLYNTAACCHFDDPVFVRGAMGAECTAMPRPQGQRAMHTVWRTTLRWAG